MNRKLFISLFIRFPVLGGWMVNVFKIRCVPISICIGSLAVTLDNRGKDSIQLRLRDFSYRMHRYIFYL